MDKLLLKKENDHRVHQTWPIPLLEADYNDNTKRLAKDVSFFAITNKLLANEQYGSIQDFTAIHLATNKGLVYDLARQKTPYGNHF